MKTVAALALCGACAGANALDITSYDTRLDVAPDGSAQAIVSLQVSDAKAGRLSLPVAFDALDEFKAHELPAGVVVAPRVSKGQSRVEIELQNDLPDGTKLGFSFRIPGVLFAPKPEEGQKSTLPAGTRLLNHAFVNTQPAPIARYRLTVLLPGDSLVHAIREQLPKPKRKEFVPRVELDRFDDRQGALLQFTGLRQGDRTSMSLEVVEARRSLGWLLVLLPIAVAYLFAFRDLTRPER